MNPPRKALFAALVIFSASQAQDGPWQTYTYPNPGFAIQFPDVPQVQAGRFKNALGMTLPLTRYVVRQNGVEYTVSVVDYSSTNADALSTIGETAKSFGAKGKVDAATGARVNGNHGRRLTLTGSDGSRSDIAIFFVDHHLYTVVGQAFAPDPTPRSADTARFQRSLQFLGDDSGFLGLFGGAGRTTLNTAVSPVTSVTTKPNEARAADTAGGRGDDSRSHAAEHLRTDANERADAACAGRSAGDLVQLQTPAGPVSATCTLTARPNPPSNSAPVGSPDGRNSNNRRGATPVN